MTVIALPTLITYAAVYKAINNYAISHFQVFNLGTLLDDFTDKFMSHSYPIRLPPVTMKDMELGTTDRG
jgi:hypothetical protein